MHTIPIFLCKEALELLSIFQASHLFLDLQNIVRGAIFIDLRRWMNCIDFWVLNYVKMECNILILLISMDTNLKFTS